MESHGKKYKEKEKLIDKKKVYSIGEAVKLVKQTGVAKFDESVDLSLKLALDAKKSETSRGTMILPAGTGKSVKIGVITKDEKVKDATAAGADFAGSTDLIEKIQGGWIDFDVLVATPDMMSQIGRLGKVLGQRGLMPNPKTGTVTTDVATTVKEFKKGKVSFKSDKAGVLHLKVGKLSFEEDKLKSNIVTALDAVLKTKPSGTSGMFIKNAIISSTMGPGIKLETGEIGE